MGRTLRGAARMATALAAVMCAVLFTQCDQKEKVLDVKTPNKRIEVERSKETGGVDAKVESRKDKLNDNRIDVKTPKARVQVERAKDGGLPKVEVDTAK